MRVNAELLLSYCIHAIYQVLIGSHLVVLHISSGDGVKEFLGTDDLGSFYGRQVH